jgi:hypothetical protein
MSQRPFDYSSPYPDGLPGHHGRDTEVAAAEQAAKTAGSGCQRVLDMLREADRSGLTDLEGQAAYFSFPKRRCDLTHAGLVVDSGRRRSTPRGSMAVVWLLASVRERMVAESQA